ncbi:MAG: GTPase Era [Armatimonadota bacterium]|nr:GTPase Era [bacterium]MDW8319894.1 GTPase Era [Armatimonadota bacterium]
MSREQIPAHCGFVAIVGKPNVGKSTLLNVMLGVKVAPITSRPQTTRRGVRGIYTEGNRQVVFVDTPGWHQPKDRLGQFMIEQIDTALEDINLVLWVVDLRHPPTPEDEDLANRLQGVDAPIWIVGNKLDAAKHPEQAMQAYAALLPKAQRHITLSALKDPKAVYRLREEILLAMPESPFFYPADIRSDQSRQDWAAEIVREQVMSRLREEIPYSIAARVTDWQERSNGVQYIRAEIIVEREGHKAIVIGKGGQMLKQIGREAREQLELFLGSKVYLELVVKVMPDWRRDPRALRELGYE